MTGASGSLYYNAFFFNRKMGQLEVGGWGGGGLISSGLAQQCTVFVKGVDYE